MPLEKIAELVKKTITATGTVALVAAQGAGADENGNKKMTITAYNGGLMNVGWGLPVGLDLAGLKWRGAYQCP